MLRSESLDQIRANWTFGGKGEKARHALHLGLPLTRAPRVALGRAQRAGDPAVEAHGREPLSQRQASRRPLSAGARDEGYGQRSEATQSQDSKKGKEKSRRQGNRVHTRK